MGICPYCGGSNGDGKHHLADIKIDMVNGKIVERGEIWKCCKTNQTFSGSLDSDASDYAKRDYEIRRGLYWNLIITNVWRGRGDKLEYDILLEIAECYELLEEYKLALSWLDKGSENFPQNSEIIFRKCRIFIKQGKPDLAHLECLKAGKDGEIKFNNWLECNKL